MGKDCASLSGSDDELGELDGLETQASKSGEVDVVRSKGGSRSFNSTKKANAKRVMDPVMKKVIFNRTPSFHWWTHRF